MLGNTSYQEGLRALGRLVRDADSLTIVEHADAGRLDVATAAGVRQIDAAQLEDIVSASVAQRGQRQNAGDTADLLRAIGQGLDEAHAVQVCLQIEPTRLSVRFSDERGLLHQLAYADDELHALRATATARRNGQPLSRVLVLQAEPDSAVKTVDVLIAEFAVQVLPARYARAIAQSSEAPDLVLSQVSEDLPEALRALRSGRFTSEVPVIVLAGPESDLAATAWFAAGADDLLQEPVQPAQLRARLRTWLLRRRGGPY